MKEKILEAFQALGFQLEEMEELGYGFHYEGKNFLYMKSENDPDFLAITLPAVRDNDDRDDIDFYKAMDTINGTLKYIKAYELNDSIWLFYERELMGEEDLKLVLTKMILHLDRGYNILHSSASNTDGDSDDESDNENADDTENHEDDV